MSGQLWPLRSIREAPVNSLLLSLITQGRTKRQVPLSHLACAPCCVSAGLRAAGGQCQVTGVLPRGVEASSWTQHAVPIPRTTLGPAATPHGGKFDSWPSPTGP